MTADIRRLTVAQFIDLAHSVATTSSLSRKIDAVHLHHTWRPTRSQFKGLATIEAMRNYHVNTNGWRDIAQHLTIDPQGVLWTGRNWNLPPASQSGKNGTNAHGPFMIEIVGDFDVGKDVLDGKQRQSVVEVVACLMHAFSIKPDAIRFHRELGSPKTCPGTGVDKAKLLAEITQQLATAGEVTRAASARGAAAPIPFGPHHWLGHEATLPVEELAPGFEQQEIAEDSLVAERIREETRQRIAASADEYRDLNKVFARGGKWDTIRPYVVNLSKGKLSQRGEFEMPDGSIEMIVDSIARYAASTAQPRLMLHAHGGLVAERVALEYAQAAHRWWLEHGIYPVYFVWETGLLDVLKQQLFGARGLLGDARDRAFEALARPAGKLIWGEMKESAFLASSSDAGDGEAGGAHIFAAALASLFNTSKATKPISVHAVGHSAGAIFHAHLLPLLIQHGVNVDSLAFLAPALRNDLFNEMLDAPIRNGAIKSFAIYTMEEEAERDDDCVEPLGATLYGKSLLYLISRAFEPKRKTPLLGLEEMLRDDTNFKDLRAHGLARLELAQARGKKPNEATKALKHGGFDNDPATMASVLNDIAKIRPGTEFPAKDRGKRSVPALLSLLRSSIPVQSANPLRATTWTPAPGGSRRALCVGIDHYRDSPLAGCVSDARAWSAALRNLKFDVRTLFDAAATREAILEGLRSLVESAQPGDTLVFQYAGHGTQAEDLNGDESDRYDEALVPVDYHTGALLLDDDLADIYRRIPTDVVLTLFMDCCHSGTNSRFAPLDRAGPRGGDRRRFLALSPEVQEAHRLFREREGSPAPTTAEESLPGVIHFAACLDNQYAYESNGQGHFTKVAMAELAQAVARGTTNEAFAMDITAKVSALQRPQTPRLMRLPEGLSERRLLSPLEADAESDPGNDTSECLCRLGR